MYIHRIVIDADRINSRGGIPAMNFLEATHDVGLIEIFQTSTLAAEFRTWPQGQQKARNYTAIGGNSLVYVTNSRAADGALGTSGRESRFMEIHRVVFGEPASDEEKRKHDMRDSLHIDQANQHDADFFVTGDNAILRAGPALAAIGIGVRVCSAEDCAREVSKYFSQAYGTSDSSALTKRLNQEGPILLGSNSCGGTAFADAESGETLLAFERTEAGVGIRSIVRADDGSLLLTILPGQPLSFAQPGAEVRMEVGPAPLILGDKHCRSFAITSRAQPVLSGRVLRNGRLLIYNVSLRNKSGRLVFRVARDALECSGGTISAYAAP